MNVCFGDGSKLPDMVRYCEQDVRLLQDVHEFIEGHVPLNTHVGVVKGNSKWTCPQCGGKDLMRNGKDVTQTGVEKQKMQCRGCGKHYRITTLAYSKYLEYKLHG